ncbi:MAG: hypothetical protein JNM41_09660 [Flavipsychrobacter sp.]|nr:hypothetical protein [Flavipsychrobacter sp.]
MKQAFHILMVCFCIIGCQSSDSIVHRNPFTSIVDKPNAVKDYFAQNNWNFPFQVDSLLPIQFGEFPDSPQVFADSMQMQVKRVTLFAKAIKHFTNQGIDSTCGYHFSNPSIFRKARATYYRIFLQKYKNNRDPKADCECAQLDSGRVHAYRFLMQFKMLQNDSLLFESWMD